MISNRITGVFFRKICVNTKIGGCSFSPITGVCSLCTLEKWYILCKLENATINKKNEISNHCFHRVPCFWIRHDMPWDLDESQCSLSSLTCLVSCCKLYEDSGVHNTSDETICNRKWQLINFFILYIHIYIYLYIYIIKKLISRHFLLQIVSSEVLCTPESSDSLQQLTRHVNDDKVHWD